MSDVIKTVNVINPEGEVVSLPEGQAPEAIQTGQYRLASPKEVNAHFEQEKYTSGVNPALAFLAGAARGPSLGTSDVLMTQTHLVKPSTLRKLKEYNQPESTAGELTGIGASLIPSMGESAVGKMVSAPMRGAGAIGRGAGKVAADLLPEATTGLGRIGTSALEHSVSGITEGALFGLGQAVSEHAMGDPDALGEKLISHVGPAALFGGGLGGILGATGASLGEGLKTVKKFFPEEMTSAEALVDAGVDTTPQYPKSSLAEGVGVKNMSPEEQAAFYKDLGKRKSSANDVEAVAMKHNLPVVEEQLITDEHLLKQAQAIRDSGSPLGVSRMQKMQQGFEYWKNKFDDMLGGPSEVSSKELGDSIAERVADRLSEGQAEFGSRFKGINDLQKSVEISDKARLKFADTQKAVWADTEKVSESLAKDLQAASNEIIRKNTGEGLIKSIQEVKEQSRSAFREGLSTKGTELARVASDAEELLHNETIRLAEEMGPYGAREGATSIVDEYKKTMEDYKAFKKEQRQLARSLGVGENKQAYQLKEAIAKKNPQALVRSLFNEGNVRNAEFFNKYAPEIMEDIKKFQRNEIRDAAIKGEGVPLDPMRVLKETHGMPKELKNILFNPDEQMLLREGGVYLHSYPKNFNPSGSASGVAYLQKMFNIFNTGDMAMHWAKLGKDAYTIHQLKKAGMKADDLVHANWFATAQENATNKIKSAAKSIFKITKDAEPYVVGKSSSMAADLMIDHKKQKKLIDTVHMLNTDPQMFVDHLEKMTSPIYKIAPKSAQAAHATAIRTAQYLSQAAPAMKSDYALGEDPIPSKYEMNIFGQRLKALSDPSMILRELKQGTLVPAHIEAIATVYPKMYQEMQTEVMDQMTKAIAKKQLIPYRMKNMLSLFLNHDMDASITPQAILSNQAAMARSQAQHDQRNMAMATPHKSTQKGLEDLNRSSELMTSMQKSSLRMT